MTRVQTCALPISTLAATAGPGIQIDFNEPVDGFGKVDFTLVAMDKDSDPIDLPAEKVTVTLDATAKRGIITIAEGVLPAGRNVVTLTLLSSITDLAETPNALVPVSHELVFEIAEVAEVAE